MSEKHKPALWGPLIVVAAWLAIAAVCVKVARGQDRIILERGADGRWTLVEQPPPTTRETPVPEIPARELPIVHAGEMAGSAWHFEVQASHHDNIEWDFGDPGSSYNIVAGGFSASHVYEKPGTYVVRCIVTPMNAQRVQAAPAILSARTIKVEPDTRRTITRPSELADNTRLMLSGDVKVTSAIRIVHRNVIVDLADAIVTYTGKAGDGKYIIDVEGDNATIVEGDYRSTDIGYRKGAPVAVNVRGRNCAIIEGRASGRLSKFVNVQQPHAGSFVHIQDTWAAPGSCDLVWLWCNGQYVHAYGNGGMDAVGEHYVRAQHFDHLSLLYNSWQTSAPPDFNAPYKVGTRHSTRTTTAIQIGRDFWAGYNLFGAESPLGPGVNNDPLPGETPAQETLERARFEHNTMKHGGIVIVRGCVGVTVNDCTVEAWRENPLKTDANGQRWAITTNTDPLAVPRPIGAIEVGGDGADRQHLRPFRDVTIANITHNCERLVRITNSTPDQFVVNGVRH